MIIYLFCSSFSVCIFSRMYNWWRSLFSSGGPDLVEEFSNRTFLYACFINLSLYIFYLTLTFSSGSLSSKWLSSLSLTIYFFSFFLPHCTLVSLSHTSLSTVWSCHAAKTQSAFESKTPGKNSVLYIFLMQSREDRWSPRIWLNAIRHCNFGHVTFTCSLSSRARFNAGSALRAYRYIWALH